MRSATASAAARSPSATTTTLMHGAGISASEKPGRIDTASMPSASAARAASTARRIAPSALALRSVDVISGGCRHASTGRARP